MNRSHFRFSPWPVILPICAVAMAVAVFAVTQSVTQREAHVNALNRQLLSEQQTLRVLDAEWAYLTRPQRLEELMAMKTDHGVMPPAPAPVANLVPQEIPQDVPAENAAIETPLAESAKVETPVPAAPAPKKAVKSEAKKSAVKTASLKAGPAQKKTKAASYEGAWRIAPKKAPAYAVQAQMPRPQMPRTASAMPRAGVARPIME